MGADDDCYELLLEGEPTGIVEVPFEWVRDDAVYFMTNRFSGLRPYTPPEGVFDIFRRDCQQLLIIFAAFQRKIHGRFF